MTENKPQEADNLCPDVAVHFNFQVSQFTEASSHSTDKLRINRHAATLNHP